MNLQQLRYLVAVLDSGSLSAAARSLHVSQPVISRSVRDFEREHQVKMFRLSGRRLVATDAGAAVIASARGAIEAIDAVAEVARKRGAQAELAVATTPTNGALLGLALTDLSRQLPDVRVRVCRANETADVAKMLEDGSVELGFGVVSQLAQWRDLATVPIGEVEVVLVSPIGTNLPDSVSWTEMSDLSLVLPPPMSQRGSEIEEKLMAMSGSTPRAALVSEDRTCWIAAAQAGIGSFLSYRPVSEGFAGIEIRRFRQSDTTIVGFAHLRAPISPAAERLVELTRSSRLFPSRPPQPQKLTA